MRPRCKAVPTPRHNMIIGGKRSPERLMGRSPGGSKASFAGVRSPPLRGEASALRMAFRGKPGANAVGGFLGGTHSVRPPGQAGLKPRHNIIIGGKRTFGGLMGRCPGGSEAC